MFVAKYTTLTKYAYASIYLCLYKSSMHMKEEAYQLHYKNVTCIFVYAYLQ